MLAITPTNLSAACNRMRKLGRDMRLKVTRIHKDGMFRVYSPRSNNTYYINLYVTDNAVKAQCDCQSKNVLCVHISAAITLQLALTGAKLTPAKSGSFRYLNGEPKPEGRA
jgi:hypothetical protein